MKAYNEDQQIEMIKSLWDRYGNVILSLFVFSIVAAAGMQFWQKREVRQAEGASILYESVVTAVEEKNFDVAEQQTDFLVKHFSRSVYSSYANLILAKHAIENKEYDNANKYFNWVRQYSPSLVLKELANIRQARLLISRNKLEDAADILEKNRFKVYQPLAIELKGDVELALGHTDLAKEAYQRSLNASSLPRPILRMKVARLVKLKSLNH